MSMTHAINTFRKFTAEQVDWIRKNVKPPHSKELGLSVSAAAKRFGVDRKTITSILEGLTYKINKPHLAPESEPKLDTFRSPDDIRCIDCANPSPQSDEITPYPGSKREYHVICFDCGSEFLWIAEAASKDDAASRWQRYIKPPRAHTISRDKSQLMADHLLSVLITKNKPDYYNAIKTAWQMLTNTPFAQVQANLFGHLDAKKETR